MIMVMMMLIMMIINSAAPTQEYMFRTLEFENNNLNSSQFFIIDI
jgi:hypothetical protein